MKQRARAESGFTLIEVLVGMTMGLVVVGAMLGLIVVVGHAEQASSYRNAAQSQARTAIDLIERQLRNIASPISTPKLIERASPYDLVFQTVATPSGSNTGGAERVRYCIPDDPSPGSTSTEALIGQVQTWTTATAPVIPWNSTSCPDQSAQGTAGQYLVVVPSLMNRYLGRTDRPAFSYDNGSAPSDLTSIISVQIDLFVNPPPGVSGAQTELHSGVFLRNQVRAPVADFTTTDMGSGGILLNAGTSYDPDGADLTYSWSCTTPGCPSATTLSGAASGLVVWHPGAGTYSVVLTVTDPTGLTDTVAKVVTVT